MNNVLLNLENLLRFIIFYMRGIDKLNELQLPWNAKNK